MANPAATPQTQAPIYAESEFNYEPPAEPDASEAESFNQSLKDIVSEIEDEYSPAPEFTDEELGTEPAPAEAEEPAGVEKDEPAVTRGLDRIIAREVALQSKEAAFNAQASEFAALKEEVETLRTQMPAKDVQERLTHSPSEVLKSLGHNPEEIVRVMIAEQLKAAGKPVPPELEKELEKAEAKRQSALHQRELQELRNQIEESKRAQESTTLLNTVAAGAREYVKTVDSKALPTLAGIVAVNPERANQEIMEEILSDARARAAADPNGQFMTYQEAAKRVETRLTELKSLFGPASTPTKQAPGKPNTPPQPKPPVRPLKPWEKRGQDLENEGIEAATREFFRQEAIAKGRRG